MHRQAGSVVGVLIATALAALITGPIGAAACLAAALMIWFAFGYGPARRWLGLPGPKKERQGRTGYKGHPGSTGRFRNTDFGDTLDVDIDNEGDVDVEDSELR